MINSITFGARYITNGSNTIPVIITTITKYESDIAAA